MSASLSSSSALTVSGRDGVLRCIKAQLQPLYAAQHLTKEEFIAASKAALQRCLELQLQEAQSGNRSASEADSVPVGKINAVVAGVLSKIAPHARKRGSEEHPNASAQEFEQHIVTQARNDVDVCQVQQGTPVEVSHQQPQLRAATTRSRKSSVTIIDPASPTQHAAHPEPTTVTGLESLPGARVVTHAPSPSASRSSTTAAHHQGGPAVHPQHDENQRISDDRTNDSAAATAAANPGKTLRAHRAQLDQIRLRLQNRVRHNDPSSTAVDTDSPRTGPESIAAAEDRVAEDRSDASTVTGSAVEVSAVAAPSPFQPLASPRKSLSSPGRSSTPRGARATESGQRTQHQQQAHHNQPTGQLQNQQEFVSPYFRRAPGTPGQGPATHQGPRSPPIAFATSGLGLPGTPQRHERPNLATSHASSLAPPSSGAHTSSAVQLGHAGKTHAGLSGVSSVAAASVVRQQRPPIRGQTPVTNRAADASLVGAHGGEHGAAAGAVTLPHSAPFAQGPRSVEVQGPRMQQQGVTGHQTPRNQTPNRRDDGFSYGPPPGASPDAITLDDLARGVNSSVVKLSTTLRHQQQQQQQQQQQHQHHHSLRRVEPPAGPPGPSSPPPRPGRSNNATPRRTAATPIAPPSHVVTAGAGAAPPLFTSDRDLQQWQAAKDERSIRRSQTDTVDRSSVDDRDVAPDGNDRQTSEHPVESSRGVRTYEQSSRDESQLAHNTSHLARPARTSAVPEDAGLFQAMSTAHTQRREQEHLHREHLGLPPSADDDGRSPIAAVRVIASDQGYQGQQQFPLHSTGTARVQQGSMAQQRSDSTQRSEHERVAGTREQRPVVGRHNEHQRQDGYPRRPPPSRKDDFMTASEFEERARSDGSTTHGQLNAQEDILDQQRIKPKSNGPINSDSVPQVLINASLLEVEITEPSLLLKADRLCFAEEAARQRLEEKEDHAWQVGITLPLEWGMRAMTGGAQVLQQNERREFATQKTKSEGQPEGQVRHSAAVNDSEYHHVDYARAGAPLDESSPHRGPTPATSSRQEIHDDTAATSAVAEAELYIHDAATTDDAANAFLTASEQRLRRDPHIDRGSSKFYEFSQAAMAQRKSEDVSSDPVMQVRRRIDRGEDVGVVEVAAAKITRLQSDGPKPSVARPGAPSPEYHDNGDNVDGMEVGYNDQRAEGQAARNTTTGGFTVTSPTSQRSVLAAALAHVNAANATPSKRALDPTDRRSSRSNDSDRGPGQESNAQSTAYDLNATYDDSDALPFPPKDHTRAIDKLTRRMNATATPGRRDRVGSDRVGEGGRHEQKHEQRSPIPGRPAVRTAGLRTFRDTPPRHAPAAAPVPAGTPLAASSAAPNNHNHNPTMVDFSAARRREPEDASQVRRTRPSDDTSSLKPAVVVDAVTSGADGDLEQKLAAQEHTIRALLRGMKEKDTLLRKMAEVEDVQATVQARKATEESWRRMRSPRRDIHHGPGARDAAISEARDDEHGVRDKRWNDDVVTISPSKSPPPPQQRAPRSTDSLAKRDEEHELRAADTPTGRRRRDLFGLGDNSDAPPDDGSSTTDAASPLNATIALTDEHGGQSGARRAVRRPQEDSNGPIAVLTPRATRASRLRQERLVATPTRAKSPVVSFAASATAGARSPRTGDATSRPSMRPSPQSGRAPTPTTRQTYSSAESSAPTAGAQEPGRGGRTSSPASSSGRRIVKPPSRAAVVEHMRELLQPAYDSGSLPQAKFVAIVQKISKEFFDTAAGRRWSTASVEEDRAWREHLRCEVDAALSQRR